MTIGIPRALLFYRYRHLWETFFRELGCDVLISGDTCKDTLETGAKYSVDENCLPLKIFMGHIKELTGRCDYILVPRLASIGRDDEYCVRFWGLPDLVKNTFKDAPVLIYNLESGRPAAEQKAFLTLGRALGKDPVKSLNAYRAGVRAQREYDCEEEKIQQVKLESSASKILIVSQPYIVHDHFLGGMLQKMIMAQGGVPLFSDRCDRERCRLLSRELSQNLYWTLNSEMIGAILLHKDHLDGVILLTAFPCGADSLVNELVLRKVKDIPIIQILVDEHQAEAGLETRIESFFDILAQRRSYNASA